MGNSKVPWWEPDKLFKDIIWEDIKHASFYANGKLLDIGCGKKPYRELFEQRVSKYIGLDLNNTIADIKADILKAKLRKNSYDTVLCTQVLEHVEDPNMLLEKIFFILKPGGTLILTAPLTGGLHEIPRDYFRFTKYGLFTLLKKSGYKVKYLKEEGNWISSLAFNICFYLEGTLNKHFLRYPKKIFLIFIQYFFYLLSKLPDRFTKPELFPINYIVVAKK